MDIKTALSFLNPNGTLNARKIRRSCGSRAARINNTKSRLQKMEGKQPPRSRWLISKKREEIKAALNGRR